MYNFTFATVFVVMAVCTQSIPKTIIYTIAAIIFTFFANIMAVSGKK